MAIDGTGLIVGAGGCIGRAIALAFVQRGVNALLCADINEDGAAETAKLCKKLASSSSTNLKVHHIVTDVTSEQAVSNLFKDVIDRFGRVDFFVNAAGFGAADPKPISAMPAEEFRKMSEVHSLGSFLCMRAALQAMLQQDLKPVRTTQDSAQMNPRYMTRGSIVIITSLASEGAFIGVGNYISAKHAVKGLVQTAAFENARDGIRVNAVAPSYVNSTMMSQFLEKSPATKKALLGDLPMGRLVEPEEIASAVLFLVLSSASYINGHTLILDGGASLSLANTPFTG